MKDLYNRLEQAEQKKNARFVKLAKVCKADLSDILANNWLESWSWWTGE